MLVRSIQVYNASQAAQSKNDTSFLPLQTSYLHLVSSLPVKERG